MEWKEVKLGDVCKISSSKRIFANEYQKEGIPFYRGKEIIEKQKGSSISNELYISQERYNFIKEKYGVPNSGDMLLTSVGTLGIPYIVGEEQFYFKDGNLTWFTHFDNINVQFLYYWFLSPMGKNQIDSKAIGSTQKALTIDCLSKFDIILPTIEDQQRIASILSSLDRKIELNNKINAQLEEMAQAIFKHWFVDFAPFKDGKFVESELGMIPEGWRVGSLTEIIELMPGGTPKTTEPSFWDNGNIPFFSPKDVTGTYCYFTEKQITEAGLNKCSSRLYPKDTVFITCRGTVGKVTLAACNMAMNQSNYAIKSKQFESQYYIYFLIKSVVERLIKKSNGAVFSAITTKDFDEKVIIPSIESIADFTKIITPYFQKIYSIGKESLLLAELRDTLLPKLMSGEIQLPEEDLTEEYLSYCKYFKGEEESPFETGTLPYFYWREEGSFYHMMKADPSQLVMWQKTAETCEKDGFAIPMEVFNSLPKIMQTMIVRSTWQAWNMNPMGGDKFLKHYGKSVEELKQIEKY